jgi:hypothetical protein
MNYREERAREQALNEEIKRTIHTRMAEWRRLEARTKKRRPRCGARCRDGHPCQARAVWDPVAGQPRNGRCRLHGGLSTGPRTAEGRARIAESNRRRGRKQGQSHPPHSDDEEQRGKRLRDVY